MSLSPVDFLRHILDECNYMLEQSKGNTFESFKEDQTLSRAFCRSFEIIGEATKKIDFEIITKYPEVDWRRMAGMRDKVIHEYFGVDYKIIWDTVEEDIPELKQWIETIIKEETKANE